MNKKEKAEVAFLEVLRRQQEQDASGIYSFDLARQAAEIPVEPTPLHRLGNFLLRSTGREERPYTTGYAFHLYPTLARLEQSGLIESDWEQGPLRFGQEYHRRKYRLAEQAPQAEEQEILD